jgi:hypothetical protein
MEMGAPGSIHRRARSIELAVSLLVAGSCGSAWVAGLALLVLVPVAGWAWAAGSGAPDVAWESWPSVPRGSHSQPR